MPSRTRTTSTAPAGRRPKVAGLRAPGRPGVTGESARPAEPVDGEDVEAAGPVTSADSTVAAPADRAPVADGATVDDAAPADGTADRAPAAASVATDAPAEPARAASPGPTATTTERPTPSSKQRRAQRAMSPAGSTRTDGGSRSGTALLERPAPRRTAPATQSSPRGGRLGSALSGAAAPFRRLGANPRMLQAVLGAVIVVCLVLAGLAFWQGREAWSQGPVANKAVVDVGGTAEVVGQTRQGIEQILSYDFAKLDDSVNAAKTQSTGAFTSQYLSVFEQTIRGPATQQKLRQTASVLNIGVKQLDADHASLMVLVQFTAERTTNQQTTNAPGLLNVDVVRQDGRWKISAINPM